MGYAAKSDRVRLLCGPYHPPALRRGHKAFCLARDCDVIVTSWTDARIPWPRCRRIGEKGGTGIIVEAELARAIKHESAAAIMHWWGVTVGVVWRWRRALGVGWMTSLGTRRLRQAASEKGAAKVRGRPLSPEQKEHRRQHAIRIRLWDYGKPGYHGRWWTEAEKDLLGREPDGAVAEKAGRTVNAVRIMRTRCHLESVEDKRRHPRRGRGHAKAGEMP